MTSPEELLNLLKYNITTDKLGSITYRFNGEVHRDEDQPAVIYADGSEYWYQHGKIHRDNDQPAVINADGTKSLYIDGKFIRSN